jgi:hypothetical protein
MSQGRTARGYPVEEFLQAIGEQLDRAQDSLVVKARAGRPLTWALRELKIALQVFVELDEAGRVLWRTAGPNETGASTVNLEFTTITRPMIEENTWSFLDDSDPRPLDSAGVGADLSEDDRRRLGRLGVRTVGQLRRLMPEEKSTQPMASMIGIPVNRLQAALLASSRPVVTGQELVQRRDETLLRIHGANLSDGIETEVRLAGDPVEVIEAQPHQLLVRPLEHHESGQIEIFVAGDRATGFFRTPGGVFGARRGNRPAPGPAPGPTGGNGRSAPRGGGAGEPP